MYALRQIYDHAAETIAVPPELQHRRIEVIFMVLNDKEMIESAHDNSGQALINVLQASPYPSLEIPIAIPVESPIRDIIL